MSNKPNALVTGDEIVTWVTIPPDGGWGWVVCFTAFFAIFIGDGSINTFALFRDDIQKDLGCSDSAITLPASIITAVYFLTGPFGCAMVNKFGFRTTAFIGCMFAAVGFVSAAFVKDIAVFIVLYGVLAGSGFALSYISTILAVGFYFAKWRSITTALASCGTSVGTILFPVIFGQLLKSETWPTKFFIVTGFCVASALICLTLRPIKPVQVISRDPNKAAANKPQTQLTAFDRLSNFDEDEFDTLSNKGAISEYVNTAFPTNAELHTDPIIIDDKDERYNPRQSVTVRSKRSVRSTKKVTTDYDNQYDKYSVIISTNENYNCFHKLMLKVKWALCCCFTKKGPSVPNRPLYRDDIFLLGSLKHLPNYIKHKVTPSQKDSKTTQEKDKKKADKKNLKYNLEVTRVMMEDDIEEEVIPCVFCSEAVKRALATMFNFALFTHLPFNLINISSFLHIVGYYIPFLYFDKLMAASGASKDLCDMTLIILGISNFFGRLGCGVVASFPKLSALFTTSLTTIITGISLCLAPWIKNKIIAITVICIFGLLGSSPLALKSIILVDLLGLELLSSAFGLGMLFQGLACLIGVPVAGILFEATHELYPVFLFAGGVFILSGIVLLFVKCVKNPLKQKEEPKSSGSATNTKAGPATAAKPGPAAAAKAPPPAPPKKK